MKAYYPLLVASFSLFFSCGQADSNQGSKKGKKQAQAEELFEEETKAHYIEAARSEEIVWNWEPGLKAGAKLKLTLKPEDGKGGFFNAEKGVSFSAHMTCCGSQAKYNKDIRISDDAIHIDDIEFLRKGKGWVAEIKFYLGSKEVKLKKTLNVE